MELKFVVRKNPEYESFDNAKKTIEGMCEKAKASMCNHFCGNSGISYTLESNSSTFEPYCNACKDLKSQIDDLNVISYFVNNITPPAKYLVRLKDSNEWLDADHIKGE